MGEVFTCKKGKVDLATTTETMTEPIPRVVSAINDALADARVGLVKALLLAFNTHTMSL